jgi:UDP-N-acetylmuramoylalanine--D-glutamate ligase
MNVKTQRFMILGASKSGCATVEYILSNGGKCTVYEELSSPKIEQSISNLKELGARIINAEEVEKALDETDVLVLSPGVPINHLVAVTAKAKGIRIIGELEFGFCQFNPINIAVTGTNGKTTTVTLIDAILRQVQDNCQLVGNVGVPVTSLLEKTNKNTVFVSEVSSFQLESVNAFCPHIACILNISPDHLERHYSMENYVFLKKRIFKNQRESEYTVLNFDDQTVKNFYTETRGKVVWVSLVSVVDGAYRENGKLYYKGEFIIDQDDLKLYGEHNVYNTLFAITCAKLMGVKSEQIATALKSFKGVKHRMELVAEINGVKYYNDSKATNTASTIVALKTLREPTILILGGSDKGEDYGALFETIKISEVKHVIITGATRYKMLSSAGQVGVTDITLTEDFDFAVKIAKMMAKTGENVLLSPACASFDRFNNFEERGMAFTKLIGEAVEK